MTTIMLNTALSVLGVLTWLTFIVWMYADYISSPSRSWMFPEKRIRVFNKARNILLILTGMALCYFIVLIYKI